MRQNLFAIAVAGCTLAVASPAVTQTVSQGTSMSSLLQDGFEIKAAAPNGSQYVVFLQKEKIAYACIFVTVNNARCRIIQQGSQ